MTAGNIVTFTSFDNIEPLNNYEECISKIERDLRSSRARIESGLRLALKRAIEKVTPKTFGAGLSIVVIRVYSIENRKNNYFP